MRVAEAGGDVKLEVPAVLNDVVPQSDVVHVVLFEGLTQ